MLAFERAVSFFFGLGFFQCGKLRFGEHQTVLGALGLQRLQALFHRLQIMPQPDTAYTGRRNAQAPLGKLIGDAHLSKGRLLELIWRTIFQTRSEAKLTIGRPE